MIRELYHQEIASRVNDHDGTALHVSDLSDCSRAVWARRNGIVMEPYNDDTYRKFDMGLDAEERVGKVLDRLTGYVIERQHVHHLGDSIGHSDFLAVCLADPQKSFVVEVKTTTFFPKMINGKRTRVEPKKEEVQWHYRIQAASYALDVNFPKFVLIIICRDSGMMAEHEYNTEDYREYVEEMLAEKANLTKLGDPMPPASPPKETFNHKGKSWRCSYCSFSACEKNENASMLEVT